MLQEIDREMHLLDQEEKRIANIQDPPQMRGPRRTFGQGGTRRLTQAEIAEKELERSDRGTTLAAESVIDLTNSPSASRQMTGLLSSAPSHLQGIVLCEDHNS